MKLIRTCRMNYPHQRKSELISPHSMLVRLIRRLGAPVPNYLDSSIKTHFYQAFACQPGELMINMRSRCNMENLFRMGIVFMLVCIYKIEVNLTKIPST